MLEPSDAITASDVQQEVARRRRCYMEALVRHLYLKTDTFEFEHGWKDKDGYPTAKKMFYVGRPGDKAPQAERDAWNALPLDLVFVHDTVMSMEGNTAPIYTACDILDYKAAPPVPCDTLVEHPVVRQTEDGQNKDDFFQAIARLCLAADEPKRQAELFGWTTPDPADLTAIEPFEQAKTTYWKSVCASQFIHLESQKETADFKACEVLRLLYLAGEIPPHLTAAGAPWRPEERLARDINFSAEVEAHITKSLLEFKFWVDDPYFVDGSFQSGDRVLSIKARRRAGALEENPAISQADIDKAVNAEIDDDEKPEEMTFWSENHQILFASSEYLAGQWMPDEVFRAGLPIRAEGPQGSRPGDMTGEQRMIHARPRLLRWLADRMRLGFSEWNALPYYEEDIESLFNLVDFCLDEEIRNRATIVLDLMLFDLARYSHNGNFGPSSGRCYADKKMCGYEPGVGDLVEVLFGTRGGVISWGGAASAGAFASSRRYVVPDVLVKIGQDHPLRLVDRSRVSLRFDEATPYGTGFESLEDAMFWWSRSAYVAKQTVLCTKRMAEKYHLTDSGPFLAILPTLGTVSVVAKPLTLLTSSPGEVDIADTLSPLTEGSGLTRANLYTYRNRHTMLSSVQNFRQGQFNAQTHVCQATLGVGATVWTTHPSPGSTLSAILVGAIAGGLIGAAAGGPLGGILGAWAGGVAGVLLKPEGIKLLPATGDGPNWWTGSASLPRVVQRDGAAIIAYQPGELLRRLLGDKTHAWFPKRAFESVEQQPAGNCNVDSANWTFGKSGDGYVGLMSAREVTWTTMGPWTDKELVADNGRNIFIIQVGNVDEFGSYEQFKAMVSGARIHINGLRLMTADFECSYDLPSPGGGRLELHIDDDQVRYNGARFSDDNFPRFETPYVKCGRVKWGQYHYTLAFGGNSLTHDFRELKTKTDAEVYRAIDTAEHDCEEDRIWVVSNRGARTIFPENTLEACRHAVEDEQAMALLVDACLTADGKVVLWHDWSPDDFIAVLRQAGVGDLGAYRPAVPDGGDDLRRETVELTLAQMRFAYGYEAVAAAVPAEPAPFLVPTLTDLVEAAKNWPGLRHLLIQVRMPADHAAQYAGEMMLSIIEAIDGLACNVTLIAEEEVLTAMKGYAADFGSKTPMAFATLTVAAALPVKEDGSFDFPALNAAIPGTSAVEAAIRNRTAVAILMRSFAAAEAFDNGYYQSVGYDVARMESFDLNPAVNQGHQVVRLLVQVKDAGVEMRGLLEMGVSGIITDDVPGLLRAVAESGLF